MLIPLDSVKVELKKDVKVENGTMEKAFGIKYIQSGKGKKGKEVEIVLSTKDITHRDEWVLFFRAESAESAMRSA